jgi:hypothetical protein
MRKFYIGIISLTAILAIYLLYSRLSTRPLPDTGKQTEFIDRVADSNVTDFGSKVGRVGDVGVGTVEKAYYEDRNDENQELERVWGFERLLSKSRDMWETEKPYMNIYQRNFTCYITADTSNLRVETAVGKSTVKDATFTSNVVVHIVPVSSGGINESYIYLDDITFLSDKSLLSTVNSVRFVSKNARMLGTGLELVYDDVLERLEYLWIFNLESLHINSSQLNSISGSKNKAEKAADTNGRAKIEQPKESAVTADKATAQTNLTQPVPDTAKGEFYRCLLSKNVFIDSPEQLIFASDEIFISDILWSKSSEGQSDPTETDARTASMDQKNFAGEAAGQGAQSSDITDVNNLPASRPEEPNESIDELMDVIVTCDNGFVVALKDSPKIFEKIYNKAAGTADPGTRRPEKFNQAEGQKTFFAPKIDYSAIIGSVIATGPSELKFYTNDLGQVDPNQPALPVKVTAQQQVRFLPDSNQAIFEGDCQCDMLQIDPNFQQQYTLLAPKLTIDLIKDMNDRSSELTPGIKHFTADGGLVRFQSRKTAGRQLLGWTKLESRKFDYEPDEGLFVATGPGIIEVDNSRTTTSETEPDKFSLNKPCIAVVREYETLKYFIQENRIVADAPSDSLIIDYFPVVNGKAQLDRQVTIYTPHIEAGLIETVSGQLKLSTLSATGGIVYEDKQGKQFDGSTLFYDADKSIVTIRGDELRPCHYNGAPVDAIEWDLKTDKIKTEIVGPAILELK